MNPKLIPLIIGIILAIIVGGIIYSQSGARAGAVQPPSTSTSTSEVYSMAEVATHASAESCWSVIDGRVYDLTAWVSQHPGGERVILSICGVDGTAAFRGQHGTAQVQADILVNYEIGSVQQ